MRNKFFLHLDYLIYIIRLKNKELHKFVFHYYSLALRMDEMNHLGFLFQKSVTAEVRSSSIYA